jgi:uncharacterized membrane protein
MVYLIAGLVIFMGTHLFSAVRSREPGKDLRKKMGEGPYMAAYSLVALAGFVLLVWGYGAARPAPVLYQPPAWLAHINLLLMLPAMILLVAAYAPAGRIKKAAKHPMLAAVKLWAFGHLLANGELNSVLLFGSFLAYAVLARIAAKRRGDNGPGPDAAISAQGDIIAIVAGTAAYAAFLFWLHPILFGVAALPG